MRISFVIRSVHAEAARRHRPFLRRLLSFLDAPEGDLNVLFCDDREIRALNRRWRGLDRSTDVLSFPGNGATAGGRIHLGDLAISVETAGRAARRAGRPQRRELECLLAHGCLHLLGFDHETDDGMMLRVQDRALRFARGEKGGRESSTCPTGPVRGREAASDGRGRLRTRAGRAVGSGSARVEARKSS